MIMAINKRIRNNKGFTLIELIVVLAVLGILALIAIPKLTGVKTDAAKKADYVAAANVGKAAEMYVQMNGVPDAANRTLETGSVDGVLVNAKYINKEDLKSQVDSTKYFTVKTNANGKVTVKRGSGASATTLYETGEDNIN